MILMMMRFASLLLVLAATAKADSSCYLECPSGHPCVTDDDNNMHCSCLPGTTGLFCDRPFESCNEDHFLCLYGGRCVPGLEDDYGNSQLFCDCTEARDDAGNKYVGKYCEHQAVDFCNDEKTEFCVNGSRCNPDYPLSSPPCLCPDGFEGIHCEFAAGTTPECTLDCMNNGECVVGIASPDQVDDIYGFFDTDGVEPYQRCVCPDGFGGVRCELQKDDCGSHHCFHGSTCLERTFDGVVKHHCDCTTANTEFVSYAGRFCQYEATSYCEKAQDFDGIDFCVNGGKCSDDPMRGCECPQGYFGLQCEFLTSDDVFGNSPDDSTNTSSDGDDTSTSADDYSTNNSDGDTVFVVDGYQFGRPAADDPEYTECTLDCLNGGKCSKGVKDLGLLSDVAADVEHLNATFDGNFEHCVCPEGFVGLDCGVEVSLCGKNKIVCLHGSSCVQTEDDYECKCDDATSDIAAAFAGDSCQHPATDVCNLFDPAPEQPHYFCVNQGVCKRKVALGEPHPGCDCPEGWKGDHCELRDSFTPTVPIIPKGPTNAELRSSEETTNNSRNGGSEMFQFIVLIVALLAIVISSVVAITMVMRNRRMQRDVELQRALKFSGRNGYRDEPDQINIAPLGLQYQESDGLAPPPPPAPYTSNSDPMASKMIPKPEGLKPEELQALEPAPAKAEEPKQEPQVYIGPPRDEDGHELHNVEIV